VKLYQALLDKVIKSGHKCPSCGSSDFLFIEEPYYYRGKPVDAYGFLWDVDSSGPEKYALPLKMRCLNPTHRFKPVWYTKTALFDENLQFLRII